MLYSYTAESVSLVHQLIEKSEQYNFGTRIVSSSSLSFLSQFIQSEIPTFFWLPKSMLIEESAIRCEFVIDI